MERDSRGHYPEIEWPPGDDLAGAADRLSEIVERLGAAYLQRQRWFGGKSRSITGLTVAEVTALPADPPDRYLLMLADVRYASGPAEWYFLPLAIRPVDRAAELLAAGAPEVLARLGAPTGESLLYDALADPDFCRSLLGRFATGEPVPSPSGAFEFTRLKTGASSDRWPSARSAAVERLRGEQSNTSVIFDGALILKAFRRVEAGLNPDLEIGRFLATRTDFRQVPRLLGYSLYTGPSLVAGLAVLQEFVPNQGDGWQYTLDRLRAGRTGPGSAERTDRGESGGSAARPGPELGDYFAAIERLGQVTGQLHCALAADPGDPAFAPEPIDGADLTNWTQAIQDSLTAGLNQLRGRVGQLPPAARSLAADVLAGEELLRGRIARLAGLADPGTTKTRYHGDYHLGQVLWTGADWVILDFEGEPARPLAERRAKHTPLKDVAGMLRSFNYAASALKREGPGGAGPGDAWGQWLDEWERVAIEAYLRGYLGETLPRQVAFVPQDPARARDWIAIFALDKAIYELGYELNNRPDWVEIPLSALAQYGR